MQDVLGFFERVTASEFAGTVITAVIILVATAICVRVATRLIRGFVKHSGHDLPSSSIFVNIARAALRIRLCLFIAPADEHLVVRSI